MAMNKKNKLIEQFDSVIDRNRSKLSEQDINTLLSVKSKLGIANTPGDVLKALTEFAKLITISKDFWDQFL
jgi:hypothetical protein